MKLEESFGSAERKQFPGNLFTPGASSATASPHRHTAHPDRDSNRGCHAGPQLPQQGRAPWQQPQTKAATLEQKIPTGDTEATGIKRMFKLDTSK